MGDFEKAVGRFIEIMLKYPETKEITDPNNFFKYSDFVASDLDLSLAGASFALQEAKQVLASGNFKVTVTDYTCGTR
jgi:hypothetical protein